MRIAEGSGYEEKIHFRDVTIGRLLFSDRLDQWHENLDVFLCSQLNSKQAAHSAELSSVNPRPEFYRNRTIGLDIRDGFLRYE